MRNKIMLGQTAGHLTDTIYRILKRRSASEDHPEIVLLESQLPAHPESNCTFIAAFPKSKLTVQGAESEWADADGTQKYTTDPWQVFGRFRREKGWLFGFIGYDMKNRSYPLKSENRALYSAPDLFMMEPSLLFKIENGSAEQLIGEPVDLNIDLPEEEGVRIESIEPEIEKADYIDAVQQIKDGITEGDFYELNYSYPITADIRGCSYSLYKKMRDVNPVPFAGYIDMEEITVCCMSPERFLKNRAGRLMSEPIKGTAGRSLNAAEDARLRKELKSVKNEAENLMIVDLVRHDLSRVCRPGSVRVSKLYDIQTFGTVHQLISRVEGEMTAGTDPVDAIKSCFPMGSMTGAPKLRVMEEIEHLESYRRGIYSGSIGYFTPAGDFDFNVVIRSSIIQRNRLTYPVGGAITGDSDPDEEWNETGIKSRVLTSVQKL